MEAAGRDSQTSSPLPKPANNPKISEKSQRQKGEKKRNILQFLKILFYNLYQKATGQWLRA